MEIRPFEREDFDAYLSWFVDSDLNRELGPMDEEWLTYVMNEQPRKEFSFLEGGILIAVIGTELPMQGNFTWYITNIAVDPSRRRQGNRQTSNRNADPASCETGSTSTDLDRMGGQV